MTVTAQKPEEIRRSVVDLITGGWRAQALYTATKFGIPDLIRDGVTTSPEIARATGAKQEGVRRLLRLLVSMGVFQGNEQVGYSNTAISEELLDQPRSLKDMCLLYGEECYTAWGHAHHAISTVSSGFSQAFGESFYSYLGHHDETAKRFQHVMNSQNIFADKVAEVFDFSGGKTVVDVGGGGGELLSTLLAATPDARGILFDREHMIPQACRHLQDTVGLDRVDLIKGDMFKQLPEGSDVYLFSRVLAGWEDDTIVEVLKNCRQAMADPRARILILDRLVQDEGSTVMPALWDLHLLVTIGGGHRTLDSFTNVLNRAGFDVERTAPLPSETTAIIAAPR